MFGKIFERLASFDAQILGPTLELAVEVAREGREGRRIGTLFTVGDAEAVLARSRLLILDPMLGHPEEARHITNTNLRGTVKELAQLDGGFIVSDAGLVLSACRYFDTAAAGSDLELPLGLGSRHFAAASISKVTRAAALVVSESSMVRVFHAGQVVAEIIPELWLLSRANLQIQAPLWEDRTHNMAVLVEPSRARHGPAGG